MGRIDGMLESKHYKGILNVCIQSGQGMCNKSN